MAATGHALLGHNRLAIVDVQGGSQPIRGEDRSVALVCNGEIYNHQRLRARLSAAHTLKSQSDSEVVLHLYEDLGAACVHELDGMFAFFVSDGQRFVAARDPFGIKPLYVGWNSQTRDLWFVSEFKALLSPCDGFMALPPGTYLTQAGEVQRWFSPGWMTRIGDKPADPAELRRQLDAAVIKRLMSDVPLGVLLSGGLDSSIIAALARPHLDALDTFAVGVPHAPDLEAAREVARALGTRHHECTYKRRDVELALQDVIYHLESYDPALVRSAIPYYFLSRLASSRVKVVLTGEGADELFGGYEHFSTLDEPADFHGECVSSLLQLHAMNLQRVDRMTMAHGLEGRVPFLDMDFVAWSMGIDPRHKQWRPGELEKALLRDAFHGWLPAAVARRSKRELSAGSSADALVAAYAERSVTDRDLARAGVLFPIDPPTTKEELLYRRVFEEYFPGRWPLANVQRWRPTAGHSRQRVAEC